MSKPSQTPKSLTNVWISSSALLAVIAGTYLIVSWCVLMMTCRCWHSCLVLIHTITSDLRWQTFLAANRTYPVWFPALCLLNVEAYSVTAMNCLAFCTRCLAKHSFSESRPTSALSYWTPFCQTWQCVPCCLSCPWVFVHLCMCVAVDWCRLQLLLCVCVVWIDFCFSSCVMAANRSCDHLRPRSTQKI